MDGIARNTGSRRTPPRVTIVGGGLVGSLSACFFAKRGHEVHLYEYREDIRLCPLARGRSINLAMSARGRAALREVGLEDTIVHKHAIPMKGRMIHGADGKCRPIPYDAVNNQCIYSVSRKYLNEVLLSAAETNPNVNLHFNHKMVSARLQKGEATFQLPDGQTVDTSADLVVGADGAFSAVRRHMLRQPLFDFSQSYIEHGYLELCIPPTADGQFAMEPNHLHIWPRGTFMMIALPNQDNSWTVTLFMPFKNFNELSSEDKLLEFFTEQFPDSIPLIGKNNLVKDFFATRPGELVSIKCKPYHVGSTAIIIGDAAHAMVPFYGQGMNAGFEDCLLLDQLMAEHRDDLSVVLPAFSEMRHRDAAAICDLAMYNYVEMRDLVNRKSFLLRKKLDELLHRALPTLWVPLYQSVTFSAMRYQQCWENQRWQARMVNRAVLSLGVTILAIILGAVGFSVF